MALWITHLMIADQALRTLSHLDKRAFSVGSIAPDCNQENEDWTDFTPPRAVTHWMNGNIKDEDDCDRFRDEYFLLRAEKTGTNEEYAFLLGYYAHLITDALYMRFLTDEARIKDVWRRILEDEDAKKRVEGMECSWNNVRRALDKERRFREIGAIERSYLDRNPDSGFIRYILPLTDFPDYIDYLPKGAIKRKVSVMGVIPDRMKRGESLIGTTEEELTGFVRSAAQVVVQKITEAEALLSKRRPA